MLTRSGCEPEPTSERYSPPRTPVLAATASRGAISDHMTMAFSLLPRTPSRTFAWWGRRLAGIRARSGRATPALRGRAGHAQHVRAHQVIRAARSLGGDKSSVRVSFTFKLRPQTAARRRSSGAAVARVPPSLRRSYARHEDPVRRTLGVSRRAIAGRPIVHDRLHHDLACAEPAPRKGAGVAPVSQGQAQNRRRYCHVEPAIPIPTRHRTGTASVPTSSINSIPRLGVGRARVRARHWLCHRVSAAPLHGGRASRVSPNASPRAF